MKQARWIVAAILIGVLGVMAWLLMQRRPEVKPTLPVAESSTASVGADLSQLLPSGAVAVIHYQGGERLKSAYEKSALGQIFKDPRMQAFLQKPKQALYRELSSQTNAPSPEIVEQLHHWLVAKESAIAVYVDDKPAVAGCVRLGADTAKAQEVLEALFKGVPSKTTRTYKGHLVAGIADGGERAVAKDVLVVATDPGRMDALLDRIDSVPGNAGALQPPALDVGEEIAWVIVDTPLALQKARASMKEPEAAAKFEAVVRELGAEHVGRVELAAGFDGVGIRVASRIPGLAPDRGLLALYGGGSTLDNDSLRLIPKDVASASAARIHLPVVWDAVMKIAETAADRDDFKQFQAKLAEFEGEAQVHLKEELIDSTGDLIVFYTRPGSSPMMGEMALVLEAEESAEVRAGDGSSTRLRQQTARRESISPSGSQPVDSTQQGRRC